MIPYPPPGPGHPTTQEKARAIIHRAYRDISCRTNSVELRLDALADVLLSYIPDEPDPEAEYNAGYIDGEDNTRHKCEANIEYLEDQLRDAKAEITRLKGQLP